MPTDPLDTAATLREELAWRQQQMEQRWPRNRFGSLLTIGEWEAAERQIGTLRAQVARLRAALERAERTFRSYDIAQSADEVAAVLTDTEPQP